MENVNIAETRRLTKLQGLSAIIAAQSLSTQDVSTARSMRIWETSYQCLKLITQYNRQREDRAALESLTHEVRIPMSMRMASESWITHPARVCRRRMATPENVSPCKRNWRRAARSRRSNQLAGLPCHSRLENKQACLFSCLYRERLWERKML